VLLGLLWVPWAGCSGREIATPALEPRLAREPKPAQPQPSSVELPAAAGDALAPPGVELAMPDEAVRSAVDREDAGSLTVEIEVRDRQSQAPIPRAELLYIDGGDELENELEQVLEINGMDLEVLRRFARRAQCDENGRARLRCRPGRLSLLALSPTHWGLDRFEPEPANGAPLLIECEPQRMLRVQVVDGAGRPVGGVPVRVAPKQRGFLGFSLGGTTRVRTGQCELGPLPLDAEGVFVAGIAGLFPRETCVEFVLDEQLPDPIPLVLPAHGSLEVRLQGPRGFAYPGAAVVEALARDDAGLELCKLEARVLPGTGRAFFPRVGLGLKLDLELELQGLGTRRGFSGPGPARAGETASLEWTIDDDFPCIVGQVVDPAGKPLRFWKMEFAGAWDDDGDRAEFTAEAVTDAGGRFAICVEPGGLRRASAQLLVYCELGHDVLGALVGLRLEDGRADFGTLALSAPGLLASGFVIDDEGKGVDGTNVELWRPEAPNLQRLAWAEPSLSGAQGEFELRGWSASPEIEVRAKFRRGPAEGRLRLRAGSSGAIVVFSERKRP